MTTPIQELKPCPFCGKAPKQDSMEGDAETAHEPKCIIYLDEDPIDVAQFYRAKGHQHLPATPTMTGKEIRGCGWKKNYEYQMYIDATPLIAVGDTQAIPLTDGMRFFCIPPATW